MTRRKQLLQQNQMGGGGGGGVTGAPVPANSPPVTQDSAEVVQAQQDVFRRD